MWLWLSRLCSRKELLGKTEFFSTCRILPHLKTLDYKLCTTYALHTIHFELHTTQNTSMIHHYKEQLSVRLNFAYLRFDLTEPSFRSISTSVNYKLKISWMDTYLNMRLLNHLQTWKCHIWRHLYFYIMFWKQSCLNYIYTHMVTSCWKDMLTMLKVCSYQILKTLKI